MAKQTKQANSSRIVFEGIDWRLEATDANALSEIQELLSKFWSSPKPPSHNAREMFLEDAGIEGSGIELLKERRDLFEQELRDAQNEKRRAERLEAFEDGEALEVERLRKILRKKEDALRERKELKLKRREQARERKILRVWKETSNPSKK